MLLHLCRILQKCTNLKSDTHLMTFLKCLSNIAEKLLNDLLCADNRSYLDSRCYLTYVISNILLASPFEGNFGANNAHKDTNLVLCLVDLVTVPTESDGSICSNFPTLTQKVNPNKKRKTKKYET